MLEAGKGTFSKTSTETHMGGCQNYGPFWGTLNIRCRIIMGTQKRTTILATTHIGPLYKDKALRKRRSLRFRVYFSVPFDIAPGVTRIKRGEQERDRESKINSYSYLASSPPEH